MKRFLVFVLFAATAFAQSAPDMAVPKVERKTESRVVQDETITRTCPEGYEGHFVDTRTGFTWLDYWAGGTGFYTGFGSEPAYTICFSKKFMDEVRKNQDLTTGRPSPPRAL